MILTVQSAIRVPGDRITFTLIDTSTGNTSSLAVEERVVGTATLEQGQDMLIRFANDMCIAVNALAPGGAVDNPLQDVGT